VCGWRTVRVVRRVCCCEERQCRDGRRERERKRGEDDSVLERDPGARGLPHTEFLQGNKGQSQSVESGRIESQKSKTNITENKTKGPDHFGTLPVCFCFPLCCWSTSRPQRRVGVSYPPLYNQRQRSAWVVACGLLCGDVVVAVCSCSVEFLGLCWVCLGLLGLVEG
jgi:hypothetical protein